MVIYQCVGFKSCNKPTTLNRIQQYINLKAIISSSETDLCILLYCYILYYKYESEFTRAPTVNELFHILRQTSNYDKCLYLKREHQEVVLFDKYVNRIGISFELTKINLKYFTTVWDRALNHFYINYIKCCHLYQLRKLGVDKELIGNK